MPSLSKKTLDIDSIVVETLFNRGVPLSTSQTYMPIVRHVGEYIPLASTLTRTYTEQALILSTIVTIVAAPTVTTLAGGGSIEGNTAGYFDATGIYALFSNPNYVTVDSNQNIYVSDRLNNRIRKINQSGNVTTFFNTPFPNGVCIDSIGNIYVATAATIQKISPLGQVITDPFASGFAFGQGLAIDLEDNIYIADANNQCIKKITPLGSVTTLAGNGTVGTNTGIGTNAQFNSPRGLCLDTLGNLYVADNLNYRICKINIATSNVTIFAGNSRQIGPSNGIGTNVAFDRVFGLVFDNSSNIYVSDIVNNRISKINIFTSNVSVFVGSSGRKDGIGTNVGFIQPRGLALDTLGNMYIADTGNQRIRAIAPTSVTLQGTNVSPPTDIYNYDTLAPVNIYNYDTVVRTYEYINSTITLTSNVVLSDTSNCPCCPWFTPVKGMMSELSYLPVSTIYDTYFYGQDPSYLLNQVLAFESQNLSIPIALESCIDTMTNLSNTVVNTFITLSNMNYNTIVSYSTSVASNSTLSVYMYSNINTILKATSTSASSLNSFFFTTGHLSTLADQLIAFGNYNYVPRPVPLPQPVPPMWQGLPPRYVGPGLSSMYFSTQSNIPLMNEYWGILSNTSTTWENSNIAGSSNIQVYELTMNDILQTSETGSSISSVFYTSNSTFSSDLVTKFYGDYVSSISTFVTEYFNSYVIPDNGPYISSAASSIFFMNSTFNSTLLGNISSGTLGEPLSTFSNIASTTLLSVITSFYFQENITILSTLNSTLLITIIPNLELTSVSTNIAGYQSLSTFYPTAFSSISTLYNNQISTRVNSINISVSSYSSMFGYEYNNILELNSYYIANPGVSSLNTFMLSTLSTSYTEYSSEISSLSTFLQYSTSIYQSNLRMINIYYSSIVPIQYYSTSTTYTGTFTSVTLLGNRNIVSTITTNSLSVKGQTQSQFSFTTLGAVNILQTEANQASLSLSNLNIYATNSAIVPNPPGNTIVSQLSSIVFNSTFTIKRLYNSTLTGLIGINTLTPVYALDIGAGDAKKLSGTKWLNPSDERIKENIREINYKKAVQEISSLRLVSYRWNKEYREAHDLLDKEILGFISQEVEEVFPSAITVKQEEGFSDFRTLNTDQLIKAKFGVTQYLLERFSTLQSRINNLILS